MLTKIFLLLLIVMTSGYAFSQNPPIEPGVSQTLARWRSERYSDVRYKLDLTLEKMSPVLKGTIEIKVNVSPGPQASPPATAESRVIPPIVLDWRKIRGSENLSTISNVTINGNLAGVTPLGVTPAGEVTPKGVTIDYEESNEHLIFRDGVVAGENVIKLDFTSPILTSGSAITRYVDKEDGSEYLYSLFVPSDASTAFPVFDQPDLKARFRLTVWRPESWKVVSNTPGTQIGVQDGVSLPNMPTREMSQNTTFSETKPISTYVFAFAAGPWSEFDEAGRAGGNPSGSEGALRSSTAQRGTLPTGRVSASEAQLSSHFYVRKSQAARFQPHAAEVFRLTREGIKYLEEYFDYKFPFPKYDIVLIPEFPFGGMEHAGATFLRESSVIFPSEPTANDYISRANVIFHEAAHQWFGDTVTMRWFDDLWLKEGFAEFMAYKSLERVVPQYNAWKAFYERNKPLAYATDSTRGTTPIYQEIPNLSAAKSAYGNIVYRKAPSFLRQAEFYLGPGKFQTAVRAFLKKHEFANAGWEDLVKEFEAASGQDLKEWANSWVRERGVSIIRTTLISAEAPYGIQTEVQNDLQNGNILPLQSARFLIRYARGREVRDFLIGGKSDSPDVKKEISKRYLYGSTGKLEKTSGTEIPNFIFPNYPDYGYGIFLLDDKSRDYVLKNIQNEKDDFLRSMMWGTLWDSVREGELDPRDYVELAIKNIGVEKDELTIQTILGRVSTAMTYYIPATVAERVGSPHVSKGSTLSKDLAEPSVTVGLRTRAADLQPRLEALLVERMQTAPTLGQRVTFYRAFLNIASTESARKVLKDMLRNAGGNPSSSEGAPVRSGTLPTGRVSASIPLKTKDKFDIVTKLAVLDDPEAPKLLADLEKTETSDDSKRYAYAAHAAFPTKENREKFWSDFVNNKSISESWIESAMGPFNSPRHSELSLPYLQRALAELPNLKRNRKIFFVNGWLSAFIGGQKSREALEIVNKFLADNPNLDRDLRLKVLENVDVVERAVKIRAKWSN